MPQAKSLYSIEPVSNARPATVVAKDVLRLFRSEYKYNISDLCGFFCCSRDWVERFILPEVRHIHLNHFFKVYVIQQATGLTTAEYSTLMKGHYFFSESDLARFWNENTSASRKTAMVDLYNYANSLASRPELSVERQRHAAAKNTAKEKARHLARMKELLTDAGYDLYFHSLYAKFEWVPIECPSWTAVCGKLTTETLERRQSGLNSNTAALNRLSKSGAVRIKLGGKTFWLKHGIGINHNDIWPIPVQAVAE